MFGKLDETLAPVVMGGRLLSRPGPLAERVEDIRKRLAVGDVLRFEIAYRGGFSASIYILMKSSLPIPVLEENASAISP